MRITLQSNSVSDFASGICGLLAKCEVKMAGYWPSSFLRVYAWTEMRKKKKKEQGR